MSQTLLNLPDQPASIEAQRPPRNTVPASFKVAGTTVAVRNPWPGADGALVATKDEVSPAPIDPITEEPVFTDSPEAFRLMAHWKNLIASYKADPAPWIFSEIMKLAEQVKALHPEILDIEPMPTQILPVEVVMPPEDQRSKNNDVVIGRTVEEIMPTKIVDATDKQVATPSPEASSLALVEYTPAIIDIPDSQEAMPFDFRGSQVRTKVINKGVFFVLHEACTAFGIKNPSDAKNRVGKDNLVLTEVTDSIGRKRVVPMVSEKGLYILAMRSDKPMAVEFTDWVAGDVLVPLRKTGTVSLVKPQPTGQQSLLELMPVISQITTTIVNDVVMPIMTEFRESIIDLSKSQADASRQIADLRVDSEVSYRLAQRQMSSMEAEITRQAGVRFPEMIVDRAREALNIVPEGLRILDERYLTVSGYSQEFCKKHLPVPATTFGKRCAAVCRERGLATKQLSDEPIGFGDKTGYPLSVLHDVRAAYALHILQIAQEATKGSVAAQEGAGGLALAS